MVRQVACQVAGCSSGGYNPLGVLVAGPYLTDPDCGNVSERSEDLKQHIAMVHDRARVEAEAEAKRLEAEAKKISAETKKFEAETARMAAENGESYTNQDSVHHKGERKAPMERPSVDEGVTEGDWSYFLAEPLY